MSADIVIFPVGSTVGIPFRGTKIDRAALIAQARTNYESVFPTSPVIEAAAMDGGKARILRRRARMRFRNHNGPIIDICDDLLMDHADPADYMPSEYCAPDSDPA